MANALAIRQAARADPSIDAGVISDFEFLQHAVVAKGRVDKALKRLRRIQAFKERYGIIREGCLADAARDLKALLRLHPGFFLSMADTTTTAELEENDTLVPHRLPQLVCYKYKNFVGWKMRSEEALAILQRACFYNVQATCYSLPAIRGGLYFIADARGLTWQHFSMHAEVRLSELFTDSYPVRLYRISILFASPIIRFFYAVMRSLINFKSGSKLQHLATMYNYQESLVYHKTQGLSLDVVPVELGGRLVPEAFYDTVLQRLEERYKRVAKFRLPKEPQSL